MNPLLNAYSPLVIVLHEDCPHLELHDAWHLQDMQL